MSYVETPTVRVSVISYQGMNHLSNFCENRCKSCLRKAVNKLEFCDNWLIFGHTLIKGIKGFLLALSICLDQSEWNSVLKISTLCRWAFWSFVKIAVRKMHFTYGRKWNVTHIFYIFPIGCLFNERIVTLRLLMSYIYIYIYIYMEHIFLMFLNHTQRRSTVGRTHLDEWSARRRDLYLTTHDNHNRQISMPRLDSNPRSQQVSGLRPLTCWDLGCVVVCDLDRRASLYVI